jgi:hypothetical protein
MYYYYLTACRWVAARAPYSFLALLATYLTALFCMVRLTDPYVTPTAPIPDLLFGFTPAQLQTIFRTEWGPAGCRAYGLAGWIEMCPYLPAYGLFTGGGLVRAAQRQGWSDRIALLGALIMLADVVETVLLQMAAQIMPPPPTPTSDATTSGLVLSDGWINVASLCNQLKWILLLVSVVVSVTALLILPPSSKRNDRAKTM